ncbi:MAG: type II toxin-antitoxin system Phd/YefM family antitoxin [Gammaproteobacteria bacterium]
MESIKVGIREFRADLADYIASDKPLAITRHGATIGYFIPTPDRGAAEVAALKEAGRTLDQLLRSHGASPDELLEEFKGARRRARER